jgi:1-acyl-sn-glycerol-3-phosphate acyltransferase
MFPDIGKKILQKTVETAIYKLGQTHQEQEVLFRIWDNIQDMAGQIEKRQYIKRLQKTLVQKQQIATYDPKLDFFIQNIGKFLFDYYFRVQVHGGENRPGFINKQGNINPSGLLVANHAGALPMDWLMIKQSLLHEPATQEYLAAHNIPVILADEFIFKSPLLANFFTRLGAVRAAPKDALETLRQGKTTAVFPEGTKGLGKLYKDRYKLARFGRGGFVKLAIDAQVPIYPVVVIGSEEIYPILFKETWLSNKLGIPYTPLTWGFPHFGALGLVPVPSQWQLHYLPPMDLSEYYNQQLDSAQLYEIAFSIKEQIQQRIDSVLKTQESIFYS